MRALRGMVVGVLLLLTGCVAYGPDAGAYGYGYGSGYAYRSAYPVYAAPYPTVVVPVVRYPRYQSHGHHYRPHGRHDRPHGHRLWHR
jgi:hypothetical protein